MILLSMRVSWLRERKTIQIHTDKNIKCDLSSKHVGSEAIENL